MKILLSLLLATIVALGVVCALQWNALKTRNHQVARLTSETDQQTKEIVELEAARKASEEQASALLRTTDDLMTQVRTQQQAKPQSENPASSALAAAGTSPTVQTTNAGEGLGGILGKMMSDPDTKKFIRSQQRIMMDQLYKPLIKQLNLTPEEASAFKDLLADNMMKGAEKATSLLSGSSATNRAELASSLAADQKSSEEQIKAFLGDERFEYFKNYQETAGERMQLNMFRQQNDSGEYPLNDLQVEQLLGLMKEEKRNAAAALQPNNSGPEASIEAMLSSEQGDKMINAQETANQRVFERARSILSSDQLQAFGAFQTNQLQMMRMGMSMARKLMVPVQANGETQQSPNL